MLRESVVVQGIVLSEEILFRFISVGSEFVQAESWPVDTVWEAEIEFNAFPEKVVLPLSLVRGNADSGLGVAEGFRCLGIGD